MTLITRAAAALLAVAIAGALPSAVSAQSWWPFGGNEEEQPPVPREPVYRQPPPGQIPAPIPPAPAPPPQQGYQAQPGYQAAPTPPPAGPQANTNWTTKNPICLQLEQRLVQEGQKGGQSQVELSRVEAELRNVDRDYNLNANKLERGCYETFIFVKSFRNTPQCKDLARQVEVSKRRLADLEARRQELAGSSGRSYQNDIVNELARNNCGANYADMARRRNSASSDSGFWQDEEAGAGNVWNRSATNGAQTYRTLCVRLCDGFYFPVSFSTLPSHFAQDAEACTSKCAAPTELYFYPNPGGSVDQSVALKTNEAYTKLKVAFRYRKEYVNGCSCKTAEYVPPPGTAGADRKADGARSSAFPARRADVIAPANITTGSTSSGAVSATPVAPASGGGGWQTEEQPATQQ